MFIDQCMKRVLKVDRHDDYNVLVEDRAPHGRFPTYDSGNVHRGSRQILH